MSTYNLELEIPNINADEAEGILTTVSNLLSCMGTKGIGGIFEVDTELNLFELLQLASNAVDAGNYTYAAELLDNALELVEETDDVI